MKSTAVLALLPLIVFLIPWFLSLLSLVQGGLSNVVITETGSSLAYPVIEMWANEYSRLKPYVTVNAASTGSGMGIAQAGEGIVDIGASDIYIYKEELLRKYGDLVHIPIFIGGVGVTYNIPELGNLTLNMTADILAGIYMGEVVYWDDPALKSANPGVKLPHKKITPIYRSDSSGTTFLFTAWLTVTSKKWKVGYGKKVKWPVGIGAEGSQGLIELVKQTPYSIGYVGIAWAKESGLPLAAVYNPTSRVFVAPSVKTLVSAAKNAFKAGLIPRDMRGSGAKVPLFNAPGKDSYPIAGFIYFLVKADQTGKPTEVATALKEFLLWVVDPVGGQKYVSIFSYGPLPDEVAQLVKGVIENEIQWPGGV